MIVFKIDHVAENHPDQHSRLSIVLPRLQQSNLQLTVAVGFMVRRSVRKFLGRRDALLEQAVLHFSKNSVACF